jgi:hypothetical protein
MTIPLSNTSDVPRADPCNIELPATEPIDITAIVSLLADRS